MAKKIFKPLAILFGIITILVIFILGKPKSTKYTNVEIGGTVIKVEIADTMEKQVRGLMFRENLGENEGMLFVFGREDFQGIWMMNMSFPIDIIWIDSGNNIVDVVKKAQPCRLDCPTHVPKERAKYVLEVNSGFAEKHGIKIGDTVDIGPV